MLSPHCQRIGNHDKRWIHSNMLLFQKFGHFSKLYQFCFDTFEPFSSNSVLSEMPGAQSLSYPRETQLQSQLLFLRHCALHSGSNASRPFPLRKTVSSGHGLHCASDPDNWQLLAALCCKRDRSHMSTTPVESPSTMARPQQLPRASVATPSSGT